MEDRPSAGRRCLTCLKATPWGALVAAALFIAGVILWVTGSLKALDYALAFAAAIGTPAAATAGFKAGSTTAITAIAITSLVMAAVVFALSLFRALQRSALKGVCCGRPQPWVFSAYRLVNFLVNVIMWLLLLVVVGVLMVMLLTLGASAAVNGAITQGIATGDQALRPLGLDFGAASDAQQALASFVNPLVNDTPLGALISESSAPFQPICPPICLNLGSFASVLQSNSCICGNDTLQRLRQLAGDCMRVGAVALAGAGAMYIAATVLLMVLSGHFVSARHDRADARKLKEQRELEYENGYAADPSDCVQQEDVLPVTSAPNSRRGTQVALGPRY